MQPNVRSVRRVAVWLGVVFVGLVALPLLSACGTWPKPRTRPPSRQEPKLRTTLGHGAEVLSMVFSPDGKTLASASRNNTVKLWNVAKAQNTATLTGHAKRVWSVAFSPDGKTLASGSSDQTVKLWDMPVAEEEK